MVTHGTVEVLQEMCVLHFTHSVSFCTSVANDDDEETHPNQSQLMMLSPLLLPHGCCSHLPHQSVSLQMSLMLHGKDHTKGETQVRLHSHGFIFSDCVIPLTGCDKFITEGGLRPFFNIHISNNIYSSLINHHFPKIKEKLRNSHENEPACI